MFRGKAGRGLTQATLAGYWRLVQARAQVEFDFDMATKYRRVHYMYAERRLPPRVIAEQMGWRLAGMLKLLETYGHGDVGALEEIDRAFELTVTPLRAVN